MERSIPALVAAIVIVLGLWCSLFPSRVLRLVCRCSSSYMLEDLSADAVYVYMIRFYGLAAVGLGLYALVQVLGWF